MLHGALEIVALLKRLGDVEIIQKRAKPIGHEVKIVYWLWYSH